MDLPAVNTSTMRARWHTSLDAAIARCLERQREDARTVVEMARRYGTPDVAILPMVRASLGRLDCDEERRAWMAEIEAEVKGMPPHVARAVFSPLANLAANRSWYLPDADIRSIINPTR